MPTITYVCAAIATMSMIIALALSGYVSAIIEFNSPLGWLVAGLLVIIVVLAVAIFVALIDRGRG